MVVCNVSRIARYLIGVIAVFSYEPKWAEASKITITIVEAGTTVRTIVDRTKRALYVTESASVSEAA